MRALLVLALLAQIVACQSPFTVVGAPAATAVIGHGPAHDVVCEPAAVVAGVVTAGLGARLPSVPGELATGVAMVVAALLAAALPGRPAAAPRRAVAGRRRLLDLAIIRV